MFRDTLGKEKKEAVKQYNSMTVFCKQKFLNMHMCVLMLYMPGMITQQFFISVNYRGSEIGKKCGKRGREDFHF